MARENTPASVLGIQRSKVAASTPIRCFARQANWTAWLEKNHAASDGLWLRIAKKGSRCRSLTYAEALDGALCYGWIDGQKKPENDQSWLQKFLPRSSRSIWSKINREKALALIEAGEMKPAGLAAIENAKRTGRWEAAYDSPRTAAVPEDLAAALAGSAKAKAFFGGLNKANRYAILWRIQTVKRPETRARKIRQFVEMLERGEKVHE